MKKFHYVMLNENILRCLKEYIHYIRLLHHIKIFNGSNREVSLIICIFIYFSIRSMGYFCIFILLVNDVTIIHYEDS